MFSHWCYLLNARLGVGWFIGSFVMGFHRSAQTTFPLQDVVDRVDIGEESIDFRWLLPNPENANGHDLAMTAYGAMSAAKVC
jgi:hypothetical protein